ncbi:CPBP family glutamic-type intramembrane protease [Micrococcus flavus]|uniref:Membrane protease YdiL (CAAX protease family) n=2 Tax=Micrococcus flavus TaxID=384602 RepID=A0A7W7L3W2_9MICC|nr:CPBP family glutamic-type intramembrane protease [Micrococcus flavus]MBB4883137.1 membrane protease YdiL (CAAX protease family) [Micrococcus flavus]
MTTTPPPPPASPAAFPTPAPSPAPWPAPASAPAAPLDLPLIGHTYPELMRTPRARWWNPLASLGMVVAGVTAVSVLLLVPMALVLFAQLDPEELWSEAGPSEAAFELAFFSAPMVLLNNLLLAALIGVALLAVLVAHPVQARFLHSVEGRVRWRWLLRAHLVLLPLFVVYILGAWLLDGARVLPRAEDWVWLLVMAFLLTPFQAAGEEYLFRGWVMLAIGAWIRRPVVTVAVSAVVSAVAFALAHGSLDPWILLDLAVFAVAAVILTWRTGGLEAAVALHVVNNVVIIVFGSLTGLDKESYVTDSAQGDPFATALSAAVVTLATVLLIWQAKRAGVERTVPAAVGARP